MPIRFQVFEVSKDKTRRLSRKYENGTGRKPNKLKGVPMKLKIISPLLCCFTLVACSVETEEKTQNAQASEEDSTEAAAIDSYLNDMIESSYDDNGNGTVDDTVKDDLKDARLQKMAEKMMSELDADASSSLSLDEFLAGPEKIMGDKWASVPAELQKKIKDKLTDDFNKNAGDDGQLSMDELKDLLASCAPRVGGHRGKGPKPGQGQPGDHKPAPAPDAAWDEILKKYDTDGDGKLSQAEFEALLADKKAEHTPKKGPKGNGSGLPFPAPTP